MHLYLQKSLLFFLLVLTPGFRGASPDDSVKPEESGKSGETRTVDTGKAKEMKKTESQISAIVPKNRDNCSSEINRILNENRCVGESQPAWAWNRSDYKNYSPSDLQCVVVKEIEENIRSNNNCNFALKSVQSNTFDAKTFCHEFETRTNYSNNPPDSVRFLIDSWKNEPGCELYCFKNLNHVYSYCQFILGFYTGKNLTRSVRFYPLWVLRVLQYELMSEMIHLSIQCSWLIFCRRKFQFSPLKAWVIQYGISCTTESPSPH